jgi:hypothetical protein
MQQFYVIATQTDAHLSLQVHLADVTIITLPDCESKKLLILKLALSQTIGLIMTPVTEPLSKCVYQTLSSFSWALQTLMTEYMYSDESVL